MYNFIFLSYRGQPRPNRSKGSSEDNKQEEDEEEEHELQGRAFINHDIGKALDKDPKIHQPSQHHQTLRSA